MTETVIKVENLSKQYRLYEITKYKPACRQAGNKYQINPNDLKPNDENNE